MIRTFFWPRCSRLPFRQSWIDLFWRAFWIIQLILIRLDMGFGIASSKFCHKLGYRCLNRNAFFHNLIITSSLEDNFRAAIGKVIQNKYKTSKRTLDCFWMMVASISNLL